MVTGRGNIPYREGKDMFMGQIERYAGIILRQIVNTIIFPWSMHDLVQLKNLFSDVSLFWKLSGGCLVTMENIILKTPGERCRLITCMKIIREGPSDFQMY